MMAMIRHRLRAAIGVGAGVMICGAFVPVAALAQSQPIPQTANAAAAKKPAKSTAPAAATPRASTDAPTQGEAGLRARVEQLEEQLVDLQVTIGTLESLAKSAGTAASSASFRGGTTAGAAADTARVEQLDVQLRALLQQVEQLADRVRSIEAAPRTAAASPRAPAAAAPPPPAAPAVAGFGAVTVTPAPPAAGRGVDSIGEMLQTDARPAAARPAGTSGDPGNPKVLYEQAYSFLLAQDYPAAEAAFSDFLQKFPGDGLAGNAQYWLGETFFFRGQFKSAAAAYYKGYQTYGRNVKAPDSLMKLAMSLDKLGQKDAACQSFAELATKFPTANPQIKSRAQAETQRIGCP